MKFKNKIIVLLLTFVMLLSFGAVNVSASDTYVVVGVSSLCGSNWDANDTNNIMAFDSAFGFYKKDYFDVPVGKYEVKVVKNGVDWYGDSTGQNFKFEVLSPCTVTVLFNEDTNEVKLIGMNISFDIKFEYSTVTAVGSGEGTWLNGALWDPTDSSNNLVEIEKGLYEKTYNNIPAGSYQLKFTLDGEWAHNFGVGEVFEVGSFCESIYNGSNIFFTLTEDSDVKITLDLRDFDYNTKIGAVYKIEYLEISQPTEKPNVTPDADPTETPSAIPSSTPTVEATHIPSATPTATPDLEPTAIPTAVPTATQVLTPSNLPTDLPGDVNDDFSTPISTIKPTNKPSSDVEKPDTNVDTGDNDSLAITTMITVFVILSVALAITSIKIEAE